MGSASVWDPHLLLSVPRPKGVLMRRERERWWIIVLIVLFYL